MMYLITLNLPTCFGSYCGHLQGEIITRIQIPQDQELDGRMWFRGMHYNCWGQEVGREELRIEMNGGVLWGRTRPGRGCSAI